MNTTIDFKTAKIIDSMSQQISHMDNAVTDFFNKMSDVLELSLIHILAAGCAFRLPP